MLLDDLCAIAFCGEVALTGESMLVVGFVVTHLVEMHLRHSYAEKQRQAEDKQRLEAEKRRLEERTDEESRRLEERMEQLQTSNERLLYDNELQRRGRPLDDGDDRSAIRRGLQAGPSQREFAEDTVSPNGSERSRRPHPVRLAAPLAAARASL
eukprot:scaffold77323_cov78-Phaeocystis_antarctica.AAC.1